MKKHGDDVTVVLTVDEVNLGPPSTMEKLVTLLDEGRFQPTDGDAFYVPNLVLVVISNWGSNDEEAREFDRAASVRSPGKSSEDVALERRRYLRETVNERLGMDLDRANISAAVRGRLPTRAIFLPFSPGDIRRVVTHLVNSTLTSLVSYTRGGSEAPLKIIARSVCDIIVSRYDTSTGARFARDAAAQIGTALEAVRQSNGWCKGQIILTVKAKRAMDGDVSALREKQKHGEAIER